jgi:alkanesulfonate monooxygenase SsuD/methylene tetrahydromethanopterin reductase-like flavin-dependent oxidoreductase (luciferase family)
MRRAGAPRCSLRIDGCKLPRLRLLLHVAETTGEVNTAPSVTAHQEGVSFAPELATTDTAADPTRHLLQAGQLADELGFDALFLPDHPTFMPDCWLHLAALAATTKRIRLGTGVACALYRHPVVLARLAADLDRKCGGRFVLGLSVGWSASELARLGLALPPTRVRQIALEETIAILHGVWGGQPFTYHGSYFATEQARIDPSPVQQPPHGFSSPGGGERGTLRQVTQYTDACQLGDFGMLNGASSPAGIHAKLGVLSQHCTAVGRAYDAILRTHFTGWLGHRTELFDHAFTESARDLRLRNA